MGLEARVNKLLNEGYDFKLEGYIVNGFNLFKKEYGLFIGFSVVAGLISGVASMIPIVGYAAQALAAALINLGYYAVARKIKLGEKVEFADFFEPFNAIGSVVGVALVVFILTVLGILCLFIPGIYLGVAWGFAVPIVYFYKGIGLWDSMEASRRVITKRWWWFLLLGICLIFINIAGALCLLVGLLVTIPASHLIMYSAFDDIMRPDEVIEPENEEPALLDDTTE